MTQQTDLTAGLEGEVLEVDYDKDEVMVRLDDGRERSFPFEPFDAGDVYQAGQRFVLTLDEAGELADVRPAQAQAAVHATLHGYVESIDPDDELAWVYVRDEEGWHRKVMPLQLFQDKGLDRAGAHFLLDIDEAGTPLELHPDEDELEMQLQPVEQTQPRWTNRPAAEAEPES